MKLSTVALMVSLSLGAVSTSALAKNNWKNDSMDAWIDGKAETVLMFNTNVNSFDINTDVRNGTVILTGKVESELDKRLAGELVRDLDGVKKVENKLTVVKDKDEWLKEKRKYYKERMKRKYEDIDYEYDEMDDDSFEWEMIDAKITTVISTKMLFDDLESGDIDVEVERGVVSLTGRVPTEAQKREAERMARSADDVKKVINRLRVAPDY